MKITPSVIAAAPYFLNAEGDRTISLRSLQIPVIENIGITNNLNEVIDLTDNDIRVLGNFPHLTKLHTILIAKNRIHTISAAIAENLPNLKSLSLMSNHIKELSDVISLRECQRLDTLILKDNPVVQKENYRLFIIWSIPSLKVLDFEKVKVKEREQSVVLFGSFANPTPLASKIITTKSKHHDLYNSDIQKEERQVGTIIEKLTDEDRERLISELQNATSLSEINRIENALRNGHI